MSKIFTLHVEFDEDVYPDVTTSEKAVIAANNAFDRMCPVRVFDVNSKNADPLLGCATTRELIEELQARGDAGSIFELSDGSLSLLRTLHPEILAYRTVDKDPVIEEPLELRLPCYGWCSRRDEHYTDHVPYPPGQADYVPRGTKMLPLVLVIAAIIFVLARTYY